MTRDGIVSRAAKIAENREESGECPNCECLKVQVNAAPCSPYGKGSIILYGFSMAFWDCIIANGSYDS
jgi:hypothetical protein